MNFRPLFNRYQAFDAGQRVDIELMRQAVAQAFRVMLDVGYSPSDVAEVMHDAVAGEVSFHRLVHAVGVRRTEEAS